MKPSPSLRAGDITLREITLKDVDDMVVACRDEDTRTWTTVPHPHEREHAVAYAERTFGTPIDQEWPRWGIESEGRWCGNVGLRMDGAGLAEHAVAGNEASRALVAKVGFHVHADPARRMVVQRGERVDVWTADLLPEDLVSLDTLLP